MSSRWSPSLLNQIQHAFHNLSLRPAPLAFDARDIDGLPDEILALGDLRAVLIADSTPAGVRDVVWRELVIRARRDGPEWRVAALGLAMPGLRRTAGFLATGWHGDTADRDAELVEGFLRRLQTIDLDESRIVGKLIDAGARAVKRARETAEETSTIRVDAAWSVPPRQPWDHPDWVLARAVAMAIIDPDECLLIAETRLGDVSLDVIAEKLGISAILAR